MRYNEENKGGYMKKILLCMLALVLVTGCTKVEDNEKGNYKEGTYIGSAAYDDGGQMQMATATVYVDASGKIASVTIDATYLHDGEITTKQALGDAYGMKSTSAKMGVISGGAEWYEQVAQISKKVLEEQDLDWVKWNPDKGENEYLDLDTISGVTISANHYIEALSNALAKAK